MPKFLRSSRLPGLVLIAALGALAGAAHADTIVSTAGQSIGLFNNNPEGVYWTQTASFTNVSVSALLSSGSSTAAGAGTVYLTNSDGPGTTAANVIAETTFSNLAYEPTGLTGIFSGLTLGPGTYYLLSSNNLGMGGLDWQDLSGATTTTAGTATFGTEIFSFGNSVFAPADSFVPTNGPAFGVQVTGTPATAVTPEPSSLLLLGTGLAGCLALAKRRLA